MSDHVCILAAGRGTRMGPELSWIHKGLLPLDDRAVLTHLVDAFGRDARFVIALGHRAGQVRAYVAAAHPDLDVVFVEVDPWDGPGSGPGRSLECCRPHLPGPFCFAPCDALPGGPIDRTRPGDWVGVHRVDEASSARYCNLRVEDGRVTAIRDKVRVSPREHRAFTGIMRIESVDAFWRGLAGGGEVAGERQVSAGLAAVLARHDEAPAGGRGLRAVEHGWTDVGDEAAYRAEVVRRHGFDFSKPGEAFFRVGDRVVKLFDDHEAAARRVERGTAAPEVFPALLPSPPGTVVYRFVEGRTLYGGVDAAGLDRLLHWCRRRLWRPRSVAAGDLAAACDAFHRGKTVARVEAYARAGGLATEPPTVAGTPVPGVRELLARVDWPRLAGGGAAVRFHGDLQFDNVVRREDGGFVLLDWRQDFAGRTDAGDLDYDLAKLLGGIRIDYARVKRGEVDHATDRGGDARIALPSCPHAAELAQVLFEHAAALGRDPARIAILTGLLHLSMTPLHGEPFGAALRDLGRVELAEALGLAPAGTLDRVLEAAGPRVAAADGAGCAA